MKILAQLSNESVLCKLPNGSEIEITLISISGEDFSPDLDIQAAIQLLQDNPQLWSG